MDYDNTIVRALTPQIAEMKKRHHAEDQALRQALEQAHGENLELLRQLARAGTTAGDHSQQRCDATLDCASMGNGCPARGVCQAYFGRRSEAVALLNRLHNAQNQFYAGGDGGPLAELLTADIVWTVPGNNRIAGRYRGKEEVFGYFHRRRDLAAGTFRIQRKDVLVGDGDQVAALTDGRVTIAGHERCWSTVGLYTIAAKQRIAACWLLPLDSEDFDEIWSGL